MTALRKNRSMVSLWILRNLQFVLFHLNYLDTCKVKGLKLPRYFAHSWGENWIHAFLKIIIAKWRKSWTELVLCSLILFSVLITVMPPIPLKLYRGHIKRETEFIIVASGQTKVEINKISSDIDADHEDETINPILSGGVLVVQWLKWWTTEL